MENELLAVILHRRTALTDAVSAVYALWYHQVDWAVQSKIFDSLALGIVVNSIELSRISGKIHLDLEIPGSLDFLNSLEN